jgi:hypothetical protein
MKNIYAIYCVLSIDHVKKENLIISKNKDKIEFPIFKIEHTRLLHNELRYNIQKILLSKTYDSDIIKNIAFSYIDIQNDLITKYIEQYYSEEFNLDNDLFIFCGMIMERAYPLMDFEWKKFDFVKSFSNLDLINSIIDFTVQKSVL